MSSKATSASWNDEYRKILIDCMRDEAQREGILMVSNQLRGKP